MFDIEALLPVACSRSGQSQFKLNPSFPTTRYPPSSQWLMFEVRRCRDARGEVPPKVAAPSTATPRPSPSLAKCASLRQHGAKWAQSKQFSSFCSVSHIHPSQFHSQSPRARAARQRKAPSPARTQGIAASKCGALYFKCDYRSREVSQILYLDMCI